VSRRVVFLLAVALRGVPERERERGRDEEREEVWRVVTVATKLPGASSATEASFRRRGGAR
jgi:hypothetical protein